MTLIKESHREFLDRVLSPDKIHELANLYKTLMEMNPREGDRSLTKMVDSEIDKEREHRRMRAHNAMIERKQREKANRRLNNDR